MPDLTPNIALQKPLESESADISVINENMDRIDSALGDLAGVPTTAKTAAGAIAELHEALQDIDVEIPDGSITPAKLSFDPATQTELDAHANGTNVHGATNAPTASRLIIRDAAGRAKVAAPAASDDIARLDSITKAQAGLGNVDNYGTATQAEAEAGTATNKFMTPQRTKQYVDRRLRNNIIWRINNGQPEFSTDGGTTWKGVGGGVEKYPNIAVLSSRSLVSFPSLTTIVNVVGKAGYLERAIMILPSNQHFNRRLRITVDGGVRFDSNSTLQGPTGGAVIGIAASGQNALRTPNRWSATSYESYVANYPYIGAGIVFCPLPDKIFFNNSLKVEISSDYEIAGYEVGYATE